VEGAEVAVVLMGAKSGAEGSFNCSKPVEDFPKAAKAADQLESDDVTKTLFEGVLDVLESAAPMTLDGLGSCACCSEFVVPVVPNVPALGVLDDTASTTFDGLEGCVCFLESIAPAALKAPGTSNTTQGGYVPVPPQRPGALHLEIPSCSFSISGSFSCSSPGTIVSGSADLARLVTLTSSHQSRCLFLTMMAVSSRIAS
jgi:hypothetical protein